MIAIIDYDAGNIRSVKNAVASVCDDFVVASDPEVILSADKVIMPGVGEAFSAMENLRLKGLDKVIPMIKVPVLGICIGYQLLCAFSEERATECLGIFSARVRRFEDEPGLKIPHMGWNRVSFNPEEPLFKGIDQDSWFYYIHSYAPDLCDDTVATTEYGSRVFSAAIRKDNFFGTQFHPEKSGETGRRLIKNFIEL